MRVINILVYVLIIAVLVITKSGFCKKLLWTQKCRDILKKREYVLLILFVTNTISFIMTYAPIEEGLFVERESYGGQQSEQRLLLRLGEIEEEWRLQVNARNLTEEELQERVEAAFLYFDNHIKGKNASLDEVRQNLDYSYDYKEFPFDVEFISDNYSILDEEGVVRNTREELLALGYSNIQIKAGISIKLITTLWYDEQSFSKEYTLTVYQQEQTAMEEAFVKAKEQLQKQEQKAEYEEGFYIPAQVGQVEVIPLEKGSITSVQVWLGGILVAVLLVLREKENRKKLLEERKNCLLRSYSWFINELVLMMGAGMQVRNIFQMLLRDFEKADYKTDYRHVLMQEVKVAVQALELGMSEEQVYYKLGRRLALPCYIKIMTLLEQNVKRGGKGIAEVLEQEELSALEQRKNLAKRMGEEAGTKLLGPMILLLLVIMIMIMLPAFWGFA